MISILLASYNGEQFIAEQIESLLCQTIQDFKLYICDDNSTDLTFSIVSEYANRHPEKIFATQNSENSGGAKHNFIKMMIDHKDDYVMLCDQDDIWLPNKIEVSLNKIREMEATYGELTPTLVHSDLKIVDEDLKGISESYREIMFADVSRTCLNNIIAQNIMAGCAAMYNRALAILIYTEPNFMVMHDWWLILVASTLGVVGNINEPTIMYRQHKGNDVGAKKIRSFKHIYYKLLHYKEMAEAVAQTYVQAESFLQTYRDKLSYFQIELLQAYSSIPKQLRLQRLLTLFKYSTFKHGLSRKVAQVFVVLKERRVT